MRHSPARGFKDEFIHALELSQHGVQTFAFFNGLVWSRGIDFERCLTVHPVVCAAKSGSLRADSADMVGCKRLAKRTGVENRLGFIGHLLDTFVPHFVFGAGASGELVNIFFLCVKRYLNLVQNLSEILM